jgi:hypothetical protein
MRLRSVSPNYGRSPKSINDEKAIGGIASKGRAGGKGEERDHQRVKKGGATRKKTPPHNASTHGRQRPYIS